MAWRNQTTLASSRGHTISSSTSRISHYELSDDLDRTHVQCLEKKYGGRERAHSAAEIIQRAYRRHCLQKQYQSARTRAQDIGLNGERCVGPYSLENRPNTISQPTLKYQPMTSLRAQLLAERSSSLCKHASFKSPRKGSVPGCRNSAESDPTIRNGRCLGDVMSPRLSRRQLFGPPTLSYGIAAHRVAGGVQPVVWVPSQQQDSISSRDSPTSTSSQVTSADGGSPAHNSSNKTKADTDSSNFVKMDSMQLNGTVTLIDHPVYGNIACRHSSISSSSASSSNGPPQPIINSVGHCHYLQGTGLSHHDSPSIPLHHQRIDEDETLRDIHRRRMYRIGLNFFNKKPDKGLQILLQQKFVGDDSAEIARFFIKRRGLSKQMIGEFLGTLRSAFHSSVLQHVLAEVPMEGQEVDMALRSMLHYFRLPTEAQKIDYVMQAFAQQYRKCNISRLPSKITTDAIYIVAFAAIMLNTDLHSPSVKVPKKMTVEEFIRNTHGAADSQYYDEAALAGIYERIRNEEIRSGEDHVTQVFKVDQRVVGEEKPRLVEQHRRLICYCRVNQILDPRKRQNSEAHQRDIFLFNDMLLMTKSARRRGTTVCLLRTWTPLIGAQIEEFSSNAYPFGLQILLPSKQSLFVQTKNADDRYRFMADVRESVAESTEMEKLRLQFELERTHLGSEFAPNGGKNGDVWEFERDTSSSIRSDNPSIDTK